MGNKLHILTMGVACDLALDLSKIFDFDSIKLTSVGWNQQFHYIIMIQTSLSGFLVTMHLGMCELYMWSLSLWASCQIRKVAGAHAPGMPGTFSPSQRVSDPDMHYGTCVTHVPWCLMGSLTSIFLWSRRRGEMFPAFPAHAQPTILSIW